MTVALVVAVLVALVLALVVIRRVLRPAGPVVDECSAPRCGQPLTAARCHTITSMYAGDEPGSGTSVSAAFCGAHCPGGCQRGCARITV